MFAVGGEGGLGVVARGVGELPDRGAVGVGGEDLVFGIVVPGIAAGFSRGAELEFCGHLGLGLGIDVG